MAAPLLSLTAALAAYNALTSDVDIPKLNLTDLATDRWWGPADEQANQDTAIHSTKIVYEENVVTDLKKRLEKTRTNVQPMAGAGFFYGFNHVALANWTEYWLNEYDFAEGEANWNKYPAYKTNIQGMDIFFYRITPQVDKNTELIPLMILHGWPSSPMEFFNIVPLLTAISKDRDFAIDLIMPALPGFGFSEGAVRPGLGTPQMAVVLRNLMHRIGYKKFYVQGGDFGGITLGQMVTRFPDEVLGYHTNYATLPSNVATFLQMIGELYPSLVVQESQQKRLYPLTTKFFNAVTFQGYLHLQATRPDTIGVALSDSPIGLLGYLFEKFSAVSSIPNILRDDGGLFNSQQFSPSYYIDTLMFYWTTQSIQTSMRVYSEDYNKAAGALRMYEIPTPVPMWSLAAPEELSYAPPTILRLKYKNILGETIVDKGGHFISHQYPELFAEDVLKAIVTFRKWHAANGTDTSVH